MANPPKQKGTAGETELLRLLAERGIHVVRAPASSRVDLKREGPAPIGVLATRPDRGQWLFTIDLENFAVLVRCSDRENESMGTRLDGLDIESKRYARFSLHTIFEDKFGRRKR